MIEISSACASRACAARSLIVLRNTPGSTWCAPALPSMRWKSLTTIRIGSCLREYVCAGRHAIQLLAHEWIDVADRIRTDHEIEVPVVGNDVQRDELRVDHLPVRGGA